MTRSVSRGVDLAFGLARAVRRLQTVVERVRAGGADGARVEILPKLAGDQPPPRSCDRHAARRARARPN